MSSRRGLALAIALAAIVVFFNRLGKAPVYTSNEAREGVYTRAMLASGDFLAPEIANHVENGETVPDKPPLFHWIAAAAAYARTAASERRAIGGAEAARRFDEWSLRFPSALACSVMVVAVATLGADLVGARAAAIAAAALVTNPQFAFQARYGRVDAILACCVTLATLLAGRAIVAGRRRSFVLAGAAAGLAVLAKGPLGMLLVTLGVCGFLAVRMLGPLRTVPVGCPLRRLPWRTALAVFIAIALPWYVVAGLASDGAILRSQLLVENVEQFTGGNGRMRLSFYLVPWLQDTLPWNLVAVAALLALFRDLRRRRPLHPGAVFCAAAWLAMLAFFQIAAYKRRAYLLPSVPLEAMLAGWILDATIGAADVDWKVEPREVARGALVCGVAAVAVLAATLVHARGSPVPELAANDVAISIVGLILAVGVLFAAVVLVRRGQRAEALGAAFLALSAFYAATFPTLLLWTAARGSAKPLVRAIDHALPQGAELRVCGIDEDPSLVVLFYFRDPSRVVLPRDERICGREAPAGFYLASAKRWAAMKREEERGPLEWQTRAEGRLRGFAPMKSRVVFAERRVRDSS
jgi:4-amino-4-deoxy-L-arabinose transferase-like glycosyltransferase